MTGLGSFGKLVRGARAARARHAERRTPTGLGFALADGVDYLDGAAWDALTAGESVFLSRDYLRALSAAGPRNVQPRCALVYRGTKPVAAIAAQAVDAGAERTVRKDCRKARTLECLDARLLVCGNLLSWGLHGVAFAAGEDRAALWPAVAEALYRIRRADKLFGDSDLILVKDAPPERVGEVAALERFSFRALETEPNMVLELSPRWRTLDDYVQSLSSSYARAVRKTAKELDAAGCTSEQATDVARVADRLHALYLQVHEQQQVRLFTLTPEFLPALAATLGERFRVSVVRRRGEIVAFASTLRDGDTAVGYFLGFDKDAACELPLYLRLLHLSVADAIALGCTRLSLGRTALEPKARLGAKPEPLRVFVRHRVPALNLLVRTLLGAIPHAEAPERDPFKRGA